MRSGLPTLGVRVLPNSVISTPGLGRGVADGRLGKLVTTNLNLESCSTSARWPPTPGRDGFGGLRRYNQEHLRQSRWLKVRQRPLLRSPPEGPLPRNGGPRQLGPPCVTLTSSRGWPTQPPPAIGVGARVWSALAPVTPMHSPGDPYPGFIAEAGVGEVVEAADIIPDPITGGQGRPTLGTLRGGCSESRRRVHSLLLRLPPE